MNDCCLELRQKMMQAEEKAKQLIKKLTYNTPAFRDGEGDENLLAIDENELAPLKSCLCDRLTQAEAQCAAYKKALDIAMSTNQSHETYCKVEAALEGKP